MKRNRRLQSREWSQRTCVDPRLHSPWRWPYRGQVRPLRHERTGRSHLAHELEKKEQPSGCWSLPSIPAGRWAAWARTELNLASGFLVRSAPKSRCVVDRVGAQRPKSSSSLTRGGAGAPAARANAASQSVEAMGFRLVRVHHEHHDKFAGMLCEIVLLAMAKGSGSRNARITRRAAPRRRPSSSPRPRRTLLASSCSRCAQPCARRQALRRKSVLASGLPPCRP